MFNFSHRNDQCYQAFHDYRILKSTWRLERMWLIRYDQMHHHYLID